MNIIYQKILQWDLLKVFFFNLLLFKDIPSTEKNVDACFSIVVSIEILTRTTGKGRWKNRLTGGLQIQILKLINLKQIFNISKLFEY